LSFFIHPCTHHLLSTSLLHTFSLPLSHTLSLLSSRFQSQSRFVSNFELLSHPLTVLFLFRCKIKSVGENVLSSLTNLVELDLSWNQLESIPTETLKTVTSLRRLILNNNQRIKIIDEFSFPDLEALIFLDLNDCQIEVIDPVSFLGLKSLRTLLLSGNKLKSLSGSVIEPLSHLQQLNLYSNPWSCDCSLRDLRIQMVSKNIPLSHDPTCSSPEKIRGQVWSNLKVDDFICPCVHSGHPNFISNQK